MPRRTPLQRDRGMDAVEIGRRIREARLSAKRSQQDVCNQMQMSRPTYIAIEHGTRGASAGEIIELAKFLGVQVSFIMGGTVTRRLEKSPLLMASDVCDWVCRLDKGDVSEGQFMSFMGIDRIGSRIVAEAVRSMARVVADLLKPSVSAKRTA